MRNRARESVGSVCMMKGKRKNAIIMSKITETAYVKEGKLLHNASPFP